MPTSTTSTTSTAPAFHAEQHTLPNGLTLYLSPNAAEPRIYTQIAVRAGSKHDPDRSTGLAHYLEHMLFKGTDKLGSSNWEAEQPILQEIAETYEAHRNTTDPNQRANLYQKIDQLSQQAAAYALPGEYDRLMAAMGARGTNAYTWVDQTVFINDIPASQLERWMNLEAERFSKLVLRLFHTELETVFEEFNISQDKDIRKVMREANDALFSPHPYGTHTTIGKGEHLKAPSHFDIYDFFAQHYVPGNMAVVLAGDFDPAEALEFARNTFGNWQPKSIPQYQAVPLPAIPSPTADTTARTVLGQEAAAVYLHYRYPGSGTRENTVAQVVTGMLSNRQAGLFDQALVQAQQVLSASAGITPMAEHASLRISIRPRQGQTLQEARQLTLDQIDRLAAGDFPDWLIDAVVVDHELTMTRSAESNQGRAGILTTAFIHRLDLHRVLHRIEQLRSVTFAEVQAFAKTYLQPEQCITVFKEQGEDDSVMKVEKPPITPVPLHTEEVSGFAERLMQVPTHEIEARFADLEQEVAIQPLASGFDLHYLPNTENQLFELLYVFEFGTLSDQWISFATKYLSFLGTSTLSNEEVQVNFYRLGLEWQVQASAHRVYLGLNGLDKHLPQGLALLENLLRDCQPDEQRWQAQVQNIEQKRRNDRADKQVILRKAMNQFGRFGAQAPSVTQPTVTALRQKPAAELVEQLHQLANTAHNIFYYGPRPIEDVEQVLREHKTFPASPIQAKPGQNPELVRIADDRVLFVHVPMVQVEVLALRHISSGFKQEFWPAAEWFNQYYGVGLSSVMFQELRESRALAYSTYAYAETPSRKDGYHFLQSFIGTQPDKIDIALEAMSGLLQDWQWNEAAAERVRAGMLQQMRTERDLRQQKYWLWHQGRDRGFSGNPRAWLYEQLQQATPNMLQDFFSELTKAPTTYLVIGDKARLDFALLNCFGKVTELSLDEIFGDNLS